MSYQSRMKSQLVVSGFDDKYIWPWIVQVFAGEKYREKNLTRVIAVGNDSLSSESKDLVLEVASWLDVNIFFLEIEIPKGLPLAHHFSEITYAPLLVADALDDPFVWLDADVLPRPGWDQLLFFPEAPKGNVIWATYTGGTQNRTRESKNEAIARAGETYFNAGVTLVNPLEWRNKGFDKQWKKVIQHYETKGFEWIDQDLLNYILTGFSKNLNAEFNWSAYSKHSSLSEPKIVHFWGSPKPWNLPKVIRNRILGKIPGLPSYVWLAEWWRSERQLLAAADGHSSELARKLHIVRNSQIAPLSKLVSRYLKLRLGHRI